MITETRNDLIKSMTDNVNELSDDVLNNVTLSISPEKTITKQK